MRFGIKESTGWTTASTFQTNQNGETLLIKENDDVFLTIDKNNNNNVDDISELFGNDNQTGFSELKQYDSKFLFA